MEVAQDPICSAQQRGGTFWKKIHNYLHEHTLLGDHPFVSDRSEASLTKRWAWIQERTTKFNAAYDKMKKCKVNGLGVANLMTQSLGQFKIANDQKDFNLVHFGWRSRIVPSSTTYMLPMMPMRPVSPTPSMLIARPQVHR
jgi:hypothetical protein